MGRIINKQSQGCRACPAGISIPVFRQGILLGLLVLLNSFHAAQPESKIKKYSLKEGFPLAIVNSITQDNKGLMWFGTDAGLVRFDGYSFKVFRYNPNQPYSLRGNFIQKVFKDSQGMLWVSSRHGLNRFDANTERFIHYQPNPRIRGSIVGKDITAVTESANGNLWVAAYKAGFSYFNRKQKTFISYDKQKLPALSSTRIVSLHEDRHGLLWVGTQDAGLNVFQVHNGLVKGKSLRLSSPAALAAANIKCLYEDQRQNVWIGTDQGLVVYQRQTGQYRVFQTKDYGLSSNIILSVREDSREMLWIGVQDGGAYKIDLRQFNRQPGKDLTFSQVKGRDGNQLTQRSVQALFEDKDHNMWVGTYGDGINMVSHVKEKFLRIQHARNAAIPKSSIRYYGICTDKEGNLWLGTDGDGLYQCNAQGQVLRHYQARTGDAGLRDKAILCAFQDSGDNLWFGSYSQGLFLYRKGSGSFVNFRHRPAHPQTLGGNDVRVIFEDSRGHIWVGTNGGGLSRYHPENGTFQNFHAGNSTLSSNDIRAITESPDGRIWLGTYGDGLYSFSPARQSFTKHRYGPADKNQLLSGVIFSLLMDARQQLWIGTEEDGLIRYDIRIGRTALFGQQQGLPGNTIYALQAGFPGTIWMSTNKGLSKLEVGALRFHNYDASDGLQEGQFNAGSSFFNRKEGIMGFGGTEGLNLFYPAQVKEQLRTPRVLITGFQLFNKPVDMESDQQNGSLRHRVTGDSREVTLQPGQSVFTIEFGAVDYAYPEKIRYAYQLEGLDKEWNFVGNQRSATYRYLEPGYYTFRIKASNQDDTWGRDYTSIQIRVLPPLWRTPQAYLIYALLVAGLAYGVYGFRKRQSKLRRRLLLARAQSRKERRLARERLDFFTEVSHEFRTPLTLMLGPLEEMLAKESPASSSGTRLQMVYRNAQKLLGLINRLLDYRKAESGSMILQVQEGDMAAFVEEICLPFKGLAARKQIAFSLQLPEAPVLAWYDREKVEMVLNNLLSNSFKYIGQGNVISVTLRTEKPEQGDHPAMLTVAVQDNGIGVPARQQKHLFDWFYQGNPVTPMSSGLGLALAKKLVELHQGQIFVQSTEGQGSTFGFKLPLGKAPFAAAAFRLEDSPPLLPETRYGVPAEQPETPAAANGANKKGLKKVLLVEDEEEIRQFLADYLAGTFHLIQAVNGQEGLEKALAHHPDLIVSDVMMPVMDGMDLCRALKANIRTSHIPVVLLTARTAFSQQKAGLETGADAYLTKPFSPELLKIKLDNLLQSQEKLKRFHLNLFNINQSPPAEQPPAAREEASLDEKFLLRVYEILKENLENPGFNVEGLSAALGMSRSLVYKKIRVLTGIPPVNYLRSLRMQEAARLLSTGRYKVFEVMDRVGVNDEKYFRQTFSKTFGCSPSDYARQPEAMP